MTNPGPTQEEYDGLISKLATLETELRNAQRLLMAPPNKRRGFWAWFHKSPAAVLVALMMLGIMATGAGAISAFFTANKYLATPKEYQIGYVAGVHDGLQEDYDHSELLKFRRCTRGMTIGQVHAIVEKFLRDKPQYRHYSGAAMVLTAVLESCPQ